ncbi:MAG: VOC family protein [Candidatus Babeliales bacterium]
MKVFNHVQIKVLDLNHSHQFYKLIMGILGYNVVLEIKDTVIAYGTSVHDMFEIRQATNDAKLSQSVHIAFNAATSEMVDAFYQTALQNGAKCNGRPGFRPEYEEGYYAAFVIDPNGHNIEAVYIQRKI